MPSLSKPSVPSSSDTLVPSLWWPIRVLSKQRHSSSYDASMASLSEPDFVHDSFVVGCGSLTLGLILTPIPSCSQTILHQPPAQSQALQESLLLCLRTSHLQALSIQKSWLHTWPVLVCSRGQQIIDAGWKKAGNLPAKYQTTRTAKIGTC